MIMSDALEASKDSLMAAITSTYFKLGQVSELQYVTVCYY